MAVCAVSRLTTTTGTFRDALGFDICGGTISQALPQARDGFAKTTPTGQLLPNKEIPNAMIIVRVTRISPESGNFSIGPCEGYPGVTREYVEGCFPEKLPLVVAVFGQCMTVNHSVRSNTVVAPTGDTSRSRESDKDVGSIAFELGLVGDFCAKYGDSPYCQDVNKLATASPSSSARPVWRRMLSALVVAAMWCQVLLS